MLKSKLKYFANILKQISITKETEDIMLITLWIVGTILMMCLMIDFKKNITPIAILLSAFIASVAMIKSINENKNLNNKKMEQEKLRSNDFFLFQVFIFYKIFINKNHTTNELLNGIIQFNDSVNNEKNIFSLNQNIISIFFNLINETSKLKDEINRDILANKNKLNEVYIIRDYYKHVIYESIHNIRIEYLSIYQDQLNSNHLFSSQEYSDTVF